MLIVSGLNCNHCILGYDFVKEEGLIIDGAQDEIYFDDDKIKKWQKAAIQNKTTRTIPPKTIEHIEVIARTGEKCVNENEIAYCTPAQFVPLQFHDSLTKVRQGGVMTLAIINSSDSRMTLRANDTLGFAYRAETVFDSVEPLTEEYIESIFGEIGEEPKEPQKGLSVAISNSEKDQLRKRLQILTNDEKWRQKYEDLLLTCHDVCSKYKFDLGHTTIIKHKI